MKTRKRKRKPKKLKPVAKAAPAAVTHEPREGAKRGPKARTGKVALVRVTIRFDEAEAERLRLLVAREGRASVSEFIRARVLLSDSA